MDVGVGEKEVCIISTGRQEAERLRTTCTCVAETVALGGCACLLGCVYITLRRAGCLCCLLL